MRGIRRVAMLGFLMLAFLPVAAAVSPERATRTAVPVAITQPLTMPLISSARHPILSESGLLMLVGSGLFGLAAIVRRATKV